MQNQEELLTFLETWKPDYKEKCLPYVYDQYTAFIATGKYPYLDEVKTFIMADLPALSEHQAKNLKTQVYLASGQYRAEQEEIRIHAMLAAGWKVLCFDALPTFTEGQKIELHRIGHNILLQAVESQNIYRVKKTERGVFFMKKGARTRGYMADSIIWNAEQTPFYREVA
jgi:hypothetical protein